MIALAGAMVIVLGVLIAAIRLWGAWRACRGALGDTMKISGMVFGIVIAASMLALVFRGFGGDRMVTQLMSDCPAGSGVRSS